MPDSPFPRRINRVIKGERAIMMTNTRSQQICDYCNDFHSVATCYIANRGRRVVAACSAHQGNLMQRLVEGGGEIVWSHASSTRS